MARAVDDGYEHELVPGLRGSEDARRLVEEIAFSAARLEALATDPPGLYGEAAAAADPEEGLWLAFLIAYLGPLEGVEDPFAEIARVRVPWGTGELPALDGVAIGPRGAHEQRRGDSVVAAYRARAAKAGGQAALLSGDATPQRRFDRAMERLQMSGFGRSPRYEFLTIVSRLGLADLEPWTIALASADARNPVLLAAKRVFGIGDTLNLQRRGHTLADALEVPVASLDLALYNWGLPPDRERFTAGVDVAADADVAARVAGILGVADPAAAPDDRAT
jgi:hypothetical protein